MWQSDADYIRDQDEASSWSHNNTAWGDAAANKLIWFGRYLGDQLFHDDKVADFGGNDGYAAYNFYLVHKIKPLVVDCEPKRLDYARKQYKLSTYESFIEDMKDLRDKSIEYGFTSHTLEHARDTEKAMREISRVVKYCCYFVMPLERLNHARLNHAHAVCFTKVKDWIRLLERNGWKVLVSEKSGRHEAQIIAVPV